MKVVKRRFNDGKKLELMWTWLAPDLLEVKPLFGWRRWTANRAAALKVTAEEAVAIVLNDESGPGFEYQIEDA